MTGCGNAPVAVDGPLHRSPIDALPARPSIDGGVGGACPSIPGGDTSTAWTDYRHSDERAGTVRAIRDHELEILMGMTAHAQLHAWCLLGAHPGLTLTSGRRSPERNRAVGGVPGSYHLSGRAVDLGGSRDAISAAVGTARAQRVSRGCTGPEEVIDEGDHLHVAW